MQSVTLIIDKRQELSTKYKKLLSNKTNLTIITKNLLSAIKIIQDKEPDLIIISDSIDNVADCCKKIRALTYNMRPVIIAMSKSEDIQDRLDALQNGADDFISEPVNSEEFIMRIKAHLRRELESNIDAKNLLPSQKYSLRAIKRIVSDNKFWAVMLISIENFRNYKETYTELASDKLLQTYCAIIRSTLSETDYFGSISSNEFLIVTDGNKVEQVAKFLTFAFDSVVSKFYSAQDLKRGFILMRGDEFAGRRANFVHTTIGIVTNEFIQYKDSLQLMNSLREIHSKANLHSKSNYLVERPKISAENAIINEPNNKIFIIEEDEAMILLLKTIFDLQGYEVKAFHSFSQIDTVPALMIIDAGNTDTLKGLEICKKIRENKLFDRTKLIVTSILHHKELVLNSGADLYIPKPYEISSLIKWVDILLKNT